MSDIEIVLADLGEITTRDIAQKRNPKGLEENLIIAKLGGKASKIVKDYYEEQTGQRVVTNKNAIGNRYSNKKAIE